MKLLHRRAASSSDTHPAVSHALVALHPCMTALALSPSYQHEPSPLHLLYRSNDTRMEQISSADSSHTHQKGFKSGCWRQGSYYTCAALHRSCAGTTPQGCVSSKARDPKPIVVDTVHRKSFPNPCPFRQKTRP